MENKHTRSCSNHILKGDINTLKTDKYVKTRDTSITREVRPGTPTGKACHVL